MVARALVAEGRLDEDEVGRRPQGLDLPRRGDADQEFAAGREHLLGHQHRVGRADRATDDADRAPGFLEPVKDAVVAGPVRIGPGPRRSRRGGARCRRPGPGRTGAAPAGAEPALPARLAEQILGRERRGRLRAPCRAGSERSPARGAASGALRPRPGSPPGRPRTGRRWRPARSPRRGTGPGSPRPARACRSRAGRRRSGDR